MGSTPSGTASCSRTRPITPPNMPATPPDDPVKLPRHFHDRDVTLDMMNLLKKLKDDRTNDYQKAAQLQRYVDALLNEELELLATAMMGIPCEPDTETRLAMYVFRGDWRNVALETASFMRRRAAKVLRDHQREEED